jgi:NADH-quinone oxidoreductase subunit G
LINNVETLSTVPSIIRMGGAEYAKLGVATSTGTKLVSVSGHVQRPGNYEIELGIPAREIIYGLAGGPPEGRKVKCWFPGGSSSPLLKAEDLDIPYDFDSLGKAGSMLGSGAIIVVDETTPILDVAMKTAKFYRHESCGKCTPCREGTNWTVKMLERIDAGEATPMDLEIMASVQEHIIGNCLCQDPAGTRLLARRLRHSAARPGGARGAPRRDPRPPGRRRPGTRRARGRTGHPPGRGIAMPRPTPKTITFSIDGREVQAPENTMLVDAAKLGDVEIPVFCYEPKLGAPVGACRMCLVEIEGIPKLQTGCSTPVKDGMVVYTQTERVTTAQQAVVEFLLINHPLDCPVCDKGGECPLQDITFGWGAGTSRFIEPKRHFVKPLELSPLIAIDRERCILCYRCVRFSQEISEDYQLVLLERGAHSYVSTFDGHPYVAPFSGNIIELCPVGALTSRPYRFRARPWDIEGAGSVCTLCPAQCNVTITVRDERALRVLARQNPEVDDGWLCDKGRFAYQSFHVEQRITEPLLRDGGELRPVTWERALAEAAGRLGRAGAETGAIVGGQATNEEGLLLSRLMREALGSPHLDSRRSGTLDIELHRALGAPALQARTTDLEFAHAVLVLDADPVNDAPILDLFLRKAIRRHGMTLAVASPAESSLDPGARAIARYAPGGAAPFAAALAAALSGGGDVETLAATAGADAEAVHKLADLLSGPQTEEGGDSPAREVVVLWGERLTAGPGGEAGARALLEIASALGMGGVEGAGLIEIPSAANGRGLREAGVLPNAGPGLSSPSAADARDANGIAEGLAGGELSALYLLQSDPLRDLPDAALWERALGSATTVIAHAAFLTEGILEHADVVFPAEAYAEKEGTIVHPDGRLQRLRPAIARAGGQEGVRAGWQTLSELALRLGLDLDVLSGATASRQLFETVPFYAGLTLEEIGGRGVRWQEREASAAFPAAADRGAADGAGVRAAGEDGAEPGAYRSVWDAPEVEFSPALEFLFPRRETARR